MDRIKRITILLVIILAFILFNAFMFFIKTNTHNWIGYSFSAIFFFYFAWYNYKHRNDKKD